MIELTNIKIPQIGVVIAVLMLINQLLDIKVKLANEKLMLTKLSTSLVGRHWHMLLVMLLGTTGMLSIALGPVTQSSVLFCVIGGVVTSCAVAGILVLETARLVSDRVLGLMAQHIDTTVAGQKRIVSVLGAVVLPAQRDTDKPQ